MLASFLITFREGLEAFLIVGIILSYLGRLQASKYNKYIYIGVCIGVVVSLFIAYIFQVVIYGIENELYQHYLMIFILLFATVVLSYMVVWMANQSKQVSEKLKEDLKQSATLFVEAADQGDVDAYFELFKIYRDGLGVRKNKKTATKYLDLAKENQHIEAASIEY